jgi:NAD(P)-dependent dehydrogenase (short-subunit alcohol dehydrogenase family)
VTLPWRVVWITGGSTGIGRALALSLARQGAIVAVSARSSADLAETAGNHPNIRSYPLDVTDVEAVETTVGSIERELGPIDLAILSAGVWHQVTSATFDVGRITDTMNVNYLGIVNCLGPLVPAMRQRGRGHLALVSSVAGYVGLPRGVAYSPSKAAVIALAESLADDIGRFGVSLSVINPGFVETPMTAVNKFPMPWLMSADEAAARILKGLLRRRFEIAFPWQMVALLKSARRLPYSVLFRIYRRVLPPSAPD